MSLRHPALLNVILLSVDKKQIPLYETNPVQIIILNFENIEVEITLYRRYKFDLKKALIILVL